MKDRMPSTPDSNSNTAIHFTRRITVPSITLNKDGFNSLISILEKTGQTPAFDIKTNRETLSFVGIQSLGTEKWPPNIKHFGFSTGDSRPSIRGFIYVSDTDRFGSSDITLEHNNRDWISAREDELKRFLDQHRNWHHIFHNMKYALPQGLLLFALSAYWLVTHASQRDWGTPTVFPALALFYAIWALYGILLPKVFPYLVLEPEHPSPYTRLRSALKYLIPAVFVGLVVRAILISFP